MLFNTDKKNLKVKFRAVYNIQVKLYNIQVKLYNIQVKLYNIQVKLYG